MKIYFGSIRFKLLRAFLSIVFITVVMAGWAAWLLNQSKQMSQLKDRMDLVQLYTMQVIKVDKDFFVQETINEDFYEQGESKLLEEHQRLIGNLKFEMTALLEEDALDNSLLSEVQSLERELVTYDSLYLTMLQSLKERGFMKMGLEGDMRAAAHRLENEFDHALPMSDLLMLRRHEKDYLLRRQEVYADKFTKLYRQLSQRLKEEGVDAEVRTTLDVYFAAFLGLKDKVELLGLEDQSGLKGMLNDQSDRLESVIWQLSSLASIQQKATFKTLQVNLLVMVVLSIIGGIYISFRQARSLGKPITQLTRKINHVIREDFGVPVSRGLPANTLEVEDLENSFVKMVKRIQEQLSDIEVAKQELEKQNGRLEHTASELRESNTVKDKFFSIIAHDLKGPIATLSSFLDLLVKFNEKLSREETTQMAREIQGSVNNLSELLENLLEWSRSQMGALEFQPVDLNLKLLMRKNIELHSVRARAKGITVKLEAEDDLLARGDHNMVDFVIRNLLGNALKFTRPGGQVVLRGQVREEMMEIQVEDNGVGIPEAVQSRLFKPEENVTRRGTGNEKGTGLGLLLCKEFVERNEGHIWLESKPEFGTTFYFTLQPAQELVPQHS